MFKFEENGDSLNGTFKYISSKEANWQEIIKVTASSNSEDSWHTVTQPANFYSFTTQFRGDAQYIMYSLSKNIAINISSYSLRSSANPTNTIYHLKSWNLLGSNDCKHWRIIDEKKESSLMNQQFVLKNIKVQYSGVFRCFKLEQTGPGFTSEYGFGLNAFELFGTLYNKYIDPKCTFSQKHYSCNYLLLLILLVSN